MDKIYLAGPDVFLPDAIAVGRRKKELCAAYDFEGLFPFDNEVDPTTPRDQVSALIYRANEAMIRRADIGIFNLTPFRGPNADVGTVFELGMMAGLGKPVFGYTNVAEDYLERCKRDRELGVSFDSTEELWRDRNGMSIENFGNADNLMIDSSLIDHGGCKIVRHAAAPDAVFKDLAGFEECLRLARDAKTKST
jgi:nucleoside 2-deoxyribosyltransferase